MFATNYYEDGRLDIVILGPMGSEKVPDKSTIVTGKAVEELLAEKESQHYLSITNTKAFYVHIPDDWRDGEIINGIMKRVDIADLVIVNLTPKGGAAGIPSTNVFYELGLLHAMGIPIVYLAQMGTDIPLYLQTNRAILVHDFTEDEIKSRLRATLHVFLDPRDHTDFSDNRISQFYGGLPIVDISAAVGLATGYYQNFIYRLLADEGVISRNSDQVSRLVVVRPRNVMNQFEDDKKYLVKVLASHGYELEKAEGLTASAGNKRGLNVDHIRGVILDLPSTIYPLKKSPRIISLKERIDKQNSFHVPPDANDRAMIKQLSERLLDRVQNAILYHVRKDADLIHETLLEFSSIDSLPALLLRHGVAPNA